MHACTHGPTTMTSTFVTLEHSKVMLRLYGSLNGAHIKAEQAVEVSGNMTKIWKFVIGMPGFTRYNQVKAVV